jgi:hypothetical protein
MPPSVQKGNRPPNVRNRNLIQQEGNDKLNSREPKYPAYNFMQSPYSIH